MITPQLFVMDIGIHFNLSINAKNCFFKKKKIGPPLLVSFTQVLSIKLRDNLQCLFQIIKKL
jgi:hypothetical protein